MQSQPVCLIVDDELLVRIFAADIAEEAGFTALEAGNSDDAIRLLQHRADVRIVITDIDLPGKLDGLELAQSIANRWPQIKIVVTSGRIRPVAGELSQQIHFVPKPFDVHHFTNLLRELGG